MYLSLPSGSIKQVPGSFKTKLSLQSALQTQAFEFYFVAL